MAVLGQTYTRGRLELQQMQDRVQDVVGKLTSPILDSVLISNIALSASPAVNSIDHKLGRKIRGWLLVMPQKSGDVWDAGSVTGSDADKFVLVKSTVAQTISLLVF